MTSGYPVRVPARLRGYQLPNGQHRGRGYTDRSADGRGYAGSSPDRTFDLAEPTFMVLDAAEGHVELRFYPDQ
jgi:hypothetical protein